MLGMLFDSDIDADFEGRVSPKTRRWRRDMGRRGLRLSCRGIVLDFWAQSYYITCMRYCITTKVSLGLFKTQVSSPFFAFFDLVSASP